MSDNFENIESAELDDVDNLKQFTIPKLKKSSSDALTSVETDSFEFKKDILEVIQQRFKFKESNENFSFFNPYLVNNITLLSEFDERRRMLKETCNIKDIKINFTFLHLSSKTEAEQICKEGLKIGNSTSIALGHPEMGVYVNKHPDVLPPTLMRKSQCAYLVIFKHIIGKAKSMVENTTGEALDPTPGFDCHMVKTTTNQPLDTFCASQVYIYEYDSDLDVLERPRQLLPFALLSFKVKNIVRPIRSHVKPNRNDVRFRAQRVKPDLKVDRSYIDFAHQGDNTGLKANSRKVVGGMEEGRPFQPIMANVTQYNDVFPGSLQNQPPPLSELTLAGTYSNNLLFSSTPSDLPGDTAGRVLWSGDLQVLHKPPLPIEVVSDYLSNFPYRLHRLGLLYCGSEDHVDAIFQNFVLARVPRVKLSTQTTWRGYFIDYVKLLPGKHGHTKFSELQRGMALQNKGFVCEMEGGDVHMLVLPCGESIKRLGLEATNHLYAIFVSKIPNSVQQRVIKEKKEAGVEEVPLKQRGVNDVTLDNDHSNDEHKSCNKKILNDGSNNENANVANNENNNIFNYETRNNDDVDEGSHAYSKDGHATFEYNHSSVAVESLPGELRHEGVEEASGLAGASYSHHGEEGMGAYGDGGGGVSGYIDGGGVSGDIDGGGVNGDNDDGGGGGGAMVSSSDHAGHVAADKVREDEDDEEVEKEEEEEDVDEDVAIDDDLADKIVQNCLGASRLDDERRKDEEKVEMEVEGESNTEETTPLPDVTTDDNKNHEANLLATPRLSDEDEEDDDQRLLKSLLMQENAMAEKEGSLQVNGSHKENADLTNFTEMTSPSSPARRDPREERLSMRVLNEEPGGRRKLVAKAVEVELDRRVKGEQTLLLFERFSKGLYNNLHVTPKQQQHASSVARWIKSEPTLKIPEIIDDECFATLLHEDFKTRNDNNKMKKDEGIKEEREGDGGKKKAQGKSGIDVEVLEEALRSCLRSGHTQYLRLIKKDSGVAMKEEKYVDDHASKVIHSNKPLTSGASQGRYKRLWGSGRPFVCKDDCKYQLIEAINNISDQNNSINNKNDKNNYNINNNNNYITNNSTCINMSNRESHFWKVLVNEYRPWVLYRPEVHEVLKSCEDMRCLGDDTDVTEGGRQGLATGRRVEVSKEWVVFKLNNHYTRVHCTSGAGGGEDGEKENDEGKNKDACNGGATQTADGGGGGGRGGDDVSGGGGGGGGGVEACRVENFPWFPGKDNFSTFSKILHEEKKTEIRDPSGDLGLDFLFSIAQPDAFGSLTSIPFLEDASYDIKQPFNGLFGRQARKGKKHKSNKPISTMKWPQALNHVDLDFPGCYKVAENEARSTFVGLDLHTYLDPRLRPHVGPDSLYWRVCNGPLGGHFDAGGGVVNGVGDVVDGGVDGVKSGVIGSRTIGGELFDGYNGIVAKITPGSLVNVANGVEEEERGAAVEVKKEMSVEEGEEKETVKHLSKAAHQGDVAGISLPNKNSSIPPLQREATNCLKVKLIINPDNLDDFITSSSVKTKTKQDLKHQCTLLLDEIFELNDEVVDAKNESEESDGDGKLYDSTGSKEDAEKLYDPITSCVADDFLNDDDESEDEAALPHEWTLSDDGGKAAKDSSEMKDITVLANEGALKLIDYSSGSDSEKAESLHHEVGKESVKRKCESGDRADTKRFKRNPSKNSSLLKIIKKLCGNKSRAAPKKVSKVLLCGVCGMSVHNSYLKRHTSLSHPFKQHQRLFALALNALEGLKKLLVIKTNKNIIFWLQKTGSGDSDDDERDIHQSIFIDLFKPCFPNACYKIKNKNSSNRIDPCALLRPFAFCLVSALNFQINLFNTNVRNVNFDSVLNKLDEVLIQCTKHATGKAIESVSNLKSSLYTKSFTHTVKNVLASFSQTSSQGLLDSSNIDNSHKYVKHYRATCFSRLKKQTKHSRKHSKSDTFGSNSVKFHEEKRSIKPIDGQTTKASSHVNARNTLNRIKQGQIEHSPENLAIMNMETATATTTPTPIIIAPINTNVTNTPTSVISNVSTSSTVPSSKSTSKSKEVTQPPSQGKTQKKTLFTPCQFLPKQGKVKKTATGARIVSAKFSSPFQSLKASFLNQKVKSDSQPKTASKEAHGATAQDGQKTDKSTINYKNIFQHEAVDKEVGSILSVGSTKPLHAFKDNVGVSSTNRSQATTPTFEELQNTTSTSASSLQTNWPVQSSVCYTSLGHLNQPQFQPMSYPSYQPYSMTYNSLPQQPFNLPSLHFQTASYFPQQQQQFANPPSYIIPAMQQVNIMQPNYSPQLEIQGTHLTPSNPSSLGASVSRSNLRAAPLETTNRRVFVFNKERPVSVEIEAFLSSKGTLSFDPYNITLLRPLSNVQCFVLVFQQDVERLNEVPNLIELKKDLRVQFVVYKDLLDVKFQRFEWVFGKGGLVHIEEDTLLNFNRGVLAELFELLSKQMSAKPWMVVLNSTVPATISELLASSADDTALEQHITILSQILSRFKGLVEYLPNDPSSFIHKPSHAQHHLHNLVSLQKKHCAKYRHFFLLTEKKPRPEQLLQFTSKGVDVLSVSEFMKGFLNTAVPSDKIELGGPLENAPSKYIDAKLSSASQSIRIHL